MKHYLLLLLSGFALYANAQSICFDLFADTRYETNGNYDVIQSGDFDEDGNEDIVVSGS